MAKPALFFAVGAGCLVFSAYQPSLISDIVASLPRFANFVFVRDAVTRFFWHCPERRFEPAPRETRAVLSVAVWVPLFTGALFSAAKLLLQRPVGVRSPQSVDSSPDPCPSEGPSKPAEKTPGVPRLPIKRNSTPRLTQVTTVTPTDSPRTSAPPSLDNVTLAVATGCSLLDVNAMLTAAAKYGVRHVVVPHGCSGRETAQGSERQRFVAGVTPRPGEPAIHTALAHVTSRTLEFIGRFRRTVHLSQVEEGVTLTEFLKANAASLHDPSKPFATVAVHRNPVPGAVYLPEFHHPRSAVYCFVKENKGMSPKRSMSFGSPLKLSDSSDLQSTTYQTYSEVTRPTDGSTPVHEGRPELQFCDHHVYIRDQHGTQTLAAMVNVTLYDRAVKLRRDALTES